MKLFLINIFTIFDLILFLINFNVIDTTSISQKRECDIFYSLVGENRGNCCSNDRHMNRPYAECENGHITKLNLYYNPHLAQKILPSIEKFPELEELNLGLTGIKEFPNKLFKLKKLKTLNLSQNSIVKIPSAIGELSELENLYLSITDISEIPNEFFNLKKLRILDLSRSAISKLPNKFYKLKNLRILNLRWNKIEMIPSSIGELSELEELNLELNYINKLPKELIKLKNLKILDLNHNNIKEISYQDYSMPVCPNNLYKKLLNNDKIGVLSEEEDCPNEMINRFSIGELSELKELYLGHNIIKELPNDFFKLKKLKKLNLEMNQIRNIPSSIGELSELEELDLGHNRIEKLPSEFFELKELEKLDLDYNRIKEIPNEISKLKKLKKLNLGSNKIETIPSEITKLTELYELDLSSNPAQEMSETMKNLNVEYLNRKNSYERKSEQSAKRNIIITSIVLISILIIVNINLIKYKNYFGLVCCNIILIPVIYIIILLTYFINYWKD